MIKNPRIRVLSKLPRHLPDEILAIIAEYEDDLSPCLRKLHYTLCYNMPNSYIYQNNSMCVIHIWDNCIDYSYIINYENSGYTYEYYIVSCFYSASDYYSAKFTRLNARYQFNDTLLIQYEHHFVA